MKKLILISFAFSVISFSIFPQVTQQWVARYNSPSTAPHSNYGTAITVDKNNNIYVTGTSTANGVGYSDKEFVTIKYNPEGQVLWTARYSNNLGDNISRDLTVDAEGNVYVTGKSFNGVNYDITTLKYDPNGNQKWSQTFKGTGNGDNLPVGVVVVGTNNIYVAGTSYLGVVQSNDYVTIKYDSSGNEKWEDFYGSGEGYDDSATAITVGEKNYIYVTGKSKGSGDLYFVSANIKYDSLGNSVWGGARRINDFNSPDGKYITNAIKVDSIGNMYLSGTAFSNNTKEDFLTVKYYPGELAWEKRYNGPVSLYDSPTALYVDSKLNVYITGKSYGQSVSIDFLTIKYRPNGDTAWTSRYTGGFGNDYPNGINVDNFGNVFLIGFGASGGEIVKIDSSGNLITTKGFSGYPNAITRDYDGNILITGQTPAKSAGGYNLVTIKYDNSLNEIWKKTYYTSAVQQDEVTCMAIDPNGSVYIGGYTYVTKFSDLDMLLVKYSPSGILQWSKRINGPANATDYIRAVTTDQSGNVYITGVSTGSGRDFLTIKFNSDGDTLWTRRYAGIHPSQNGYDEPWAISVDKNKNVFVTGESDDASTGSDWATIKYDSSGAMKWVERYDGILGGTDENSFDLTLDHSDNIIVTGFSPGNMTSDDFLTIKYNQDGDTLWSTRYDGIGTGYDYSTKVKVDSQDNIYITGRSDGITTQEDYATVKYDSNGVQQWARRYDGYSQNDEPKDMGVTKNGDVFVTGYSVNSLTGRDYFTIKYNTNGDSLWTRRYNGPSGDGYDEANSLTIDMSDNIYVSGYSEDNSMNSDFYTIAYDSYGNKLWDKVYSGSGAGENDAKTISLDKDGNIYVAGTSTGDTSGLDFALIKYSPVVNGIKNETDILRSFSLEQNYPNPFNPTTNIKYSIPDNELVELKVFDILGRKVATIENEEEKPGNYNVTWNAVGEPSGIYFYQLEAGNFVQTKKMVLIK